MRSAGNTGCRILPLLVLIGLGPAVAETGDAEVRVYGALRAMFHEGRIGTTVSLESLLPDPDLYAVGALSDLAGEVTIVGGTVYLSYPDGRTERTVESGSGATLLVSSRVARWRSVETTRAIAFDEIDPEVAALAKSVGLQLDGRFPFLLEGEFEDLHWHVIDGSRLQDGGSSHADHQAASLRKSAPSMRATLVGFYSESDQGVFTHMGSRTHLHCVVPDPLSSGHVDNVTIPAGTIVKFPAR